MDSKERPLLHELADHATASPKRIREQELEAVMMISVPQKKYKPDFQIRNYMHYDAP
jgi:hypothetical protein